MKKEKLSIQRFENASGTVSFRVFGYLHGERVRRNFVTREEAGAEKAALEIRARQVAAGYRPVLTGRVVRFPPWGLRLPALRCAYRSGRLEAWGTTGV